MIGFMMNPLLFLAQSFEEPPPEMPSVNNDFGIWDLLSSFTFGFGAWIYLPLLIWMVIYCFRHDPERHIWLWVLFLFQPLGAVIYFIIRWLPSSNWQWPNFMHRWTRGKEIKRLEHAASQIGNAHQFVQLADVLREVGRTADADIAYDRALEKEPDNMPALWGAANTAFAMEEYESAKEKTEQVLKVDPAYKFGDVSLLFAKSLFEMGQFEAVRDHLTKHILKWRQPEGLFLLAKACWELDDISSARHHLKALIVDIEASPKAIARKQLFWKGRARKMLRRLPKT